MDQLDVKIMLQNLAAVILLGAGAFLIHPYFQQVSFSLMHDIKVQTTQIGTESKLRILFCAAFAFVPLLFLSVSKLMKISETRQKIFVLSSILIAGIIFWMFKINSLNVRSEELIQVKSIQYYFALEDLNLEMYLLLGFIIGAILGAVALYRFRKRN